MSFERRAEIYVTRKLASRLRMVLKLYPQIEAPEVVDGRLTPERLITIEELVERHLNQCIKDYYPLVVEMEREIAKVERNMIEKGKKCGTKTNGTKPPETESDSSKSSSPSVESSPVQKS